jgi:hypothetical protein
MPNVCAPNARCKTFGTNVNCKTHLFWAAHQQNVPVQNVECKLWRKRLAALAFSPNVLHARSITFACASTNVNSGLRRYDRPPFSLAEGDEPMMRMLSVPHGKYVVLYFLPRLLRRDPAAERSPSHWVPITSPLRRRGPHVASVLAIWSERSTHCGAQSAVGRAKKASIRIVERYTTGTTSVIRAVREG